MNARSVAIIAALVLFLTACSGAANEDAMSGPAEPAAGTENASDVGAMEVSGGDGASVVGTGATEVDDAMTDGDGDRALASTEDAGAPSDTKVQEPQPGTDELQTEETGPIDTGRDIIRTAVISAEVPDIATASQEVINSVERVGGILFNQDTRVASDGGANRTTMVFRVPPSDFQRVLNDLSGVGSLLSKEVDATDVTGRVVDLESRITSTELSVDRLRGFLADASDLTQIATFENELRNRETDLESLRGQLRTLENQVALSTITISLTEKLPAAKPAPAIQLTTTVHRGFDDGFSCGNGTDSLEDSSEATICYSIVNTGDTALTDVQVRDASLDLDTADLKLFRGNPDQALEPGRDLVYYHEFNASGNRILSTAKVQATAIPAADAENPEIAAESADDSAELALSVFPRQTEPGFGDGLSTGWDGLTNLVRIVLVVVGFILPFIWIFPIAFFAYRAWRRRPRGLARPAGLGTPPPPPATPVEEPEPESVG